MNNPASLKAVYVTCCMRCNAPTFSLYVLPVHTIARYPYCQHMH
jgi:hypothetical protein